LWIDSTGTSAVTIHETKNQKLGVNQEQNGAGHAIVGKKTNRPKFFGSCSTATPEKKPVQ